MRKAVIVLHEPLCDPRSRERLFIVALEKEPSPVFPDFGFDNQNTVKRALTQSTRFAQNVEWPVLWSVAAPKNMKNFRLN